MDLEEPVKAEERDALPGALLGSVLMICLTAIIITLLLR